MRFFDKAPVIAPRIIVTVDGEVVNPAETGVTTEYVYNGLTDTYWVHVKTAGASMKTLAKALDTWR